MQVITKTGRVPEKKSTEGLISTESTEISSRPEAPKPQVIRLVLCRIIIWCLSILISFTKHLLFDHSSYIARSFLTTYFFCKLNPSNCSFQGSLWVVFFIFPPFLFFLSSFWSSLHLANVLPKDNKQQWAEYSSWSLTSPTHENHFTAAYCSVCVFTKRMSLSTSTFIALLDDNVLYQLRDLFFWYSPYHQQTTEGFLVTLHISFFSSLRSKVVTFNFKSWNSTIGGHKKLVIFFIKEKTMVASIPEDWGGRFVSLIQRHWTVVV